MPSDTPASDKQQTALSQWGFWLCVVLTLIACPLTLFYLLLLTQASDLSWTALLPLVFVATTLAHLSVLHRDRETPDQPVSLLFHSLVAVSGIVVLISFFLSLVQQPSGGAFLIFVAIGGVISCAVCTRFIERLKTRS